VEVIDVIKNTNLAQMPNGPLRLVGPCALHMLQNPLLRRCYWDIILSWSKFPTQYDRLSQQQLGLLVELIAVKQVFGYRNLRWTLSK